VRFTEVTIVPVVRNAVAVVAAALLPGAVLSFPAMRAITLPGGPLFVRFSMLLLRRTIGSLLVSLALLILLAPHLLFLSALCLLLLLLFCGLLLLLLLAPGLLLLLLFCGLLLLLLLAPGLLLLFLLLLLLTPGLLLLLLFCGLVLLLLLDPGLLLLFLLLLLLTLCLLLFLSSGLCLLLLSLGLGFLLLLRLGLLLLFLWLSLFLALLLQCERRSNSSEKKDQNSRADESNWFHRYCLHDRDFMRQTLFASGAAIVSHDYFGQATCGSSRFRPFRLPYAPTWIRESE